MTHTLHRQGNEEALKSDYAMLAMAATGINDKKPDTREKLIRIGEIFKQHNPANIMMENLWRISPAITAAFTDIETVKEILKTLKNEDLGISIVVSGLISEIQNAVENVGLKMHTVHLSLGVFGKKELLASEKTLEITTMCGHHCISPQSIESYVEKIKIGKTTIEKAAEKLAKPCVCGIFNTERAKSILNELI
ncbi:MAG: hypothetical protein HWN67_22345 [Candidatus Helarchaeota archaeon]|nr:hypothetical protein [Candidatus Helarchaeota archaeon]